MANYRRNTLATLAVDPPVPSNNNNNLLSFGQNIQLKSATSNASLNEENHHQSHHHRLSLAPAYSINNMNNNVIISSLKPPNTISSLIPPPMTPVHPGTISNNNNAIPNQSVPPNSSGRVHLGPARSLRTPVHHHQNAPQNPLSTLSTNYDQYESKVSASSGHSVQSMTKDMSTLTLTSASNRTSLAAPISRQSFAPSIPPSSRLSLAPQSSNTLVTATTGRSSLSARRSSTHAKLSLSSGLTSVPQTTSSIMKDPRPIREKSFQYAAIKSLIKFLAENTYDRPISPKILSSPSAKDFQAIFKFLYACLDPCFNWNDRKFEEEVPGLMKGLRYPFANDISKSHLYAVGSMHAWPSLLAMLHWMVELIQCCDQLNSMNTFDVETTNESLSPHSPPSMMIAEGGDAEAEKMFFDYLTKSYKMFLSGDDNYDAMQQELSANFSKKNNLAIKELEAIQSQIQEKDEEFHSLTNNDSPLTIAEREKASLLNDVEKYKKFIKHQDAKKSKLQHTINGLEQELEHTNKQVLEEEISKADLLKTIESQSIHPEDVDRMRTEKEQLIKTLEQLTKAKEQSSANIREKEQEKEERLADLDQLLKQYHSLAEKLSLLPPSARNAHGKNYELQLYSLSSFFHEEDESKENIIQNRRPSLSFSNNKYATLLSFDLKSTIIPVVQGLRDSLVVTFNELNEQIQNTEEQIDRLSEWCTDKLDEINELDEKVKKLSIQYATEKEKLATENKKSTEEMESLERELQKMKSDIANSFLVSQQQLQKITIEHDQISRRIVDEKEKIAKDTFRLLEDLISLKTHIETQLSGFEDWIDSQDIDSIYSNTSTMVKTLY